MSKQALDLRRSAHIMRRHKVLVGAAVGLGILIGSAYAALKPPMQMSTALVAFPQSTQSAQNAAAAAVANGVPDPFTATQEVIAGSNQVLLNALPDVRPAMSFDELRRELQVGSLTPFVISISAKSKVAADAEVTANAVARSYIRYVGGAGSPVGQVPAHLLEPARSATGSAPLKQVIIDALIGAVAGALLGAIIALAIGRNDRRLRKRDEIADSIGVPVLASVPVQYHHDAAGWTKLFEQYEPGPVDAWRLRKALHQLGLAANPEDNKKGSGLSLAVLSLSADRKALALGPQLAAFAASMGMPTALVIGPQQDVNATATLRAACSASMLPERSGSLRVAVSDNDDEGRLPAALLTVAVAVVDGEAPQMPKMVRTTATILGVSAGAVTAEQLARVAASAAADGRDIAGIFVADPDSSDPTTGRAPQLARPGRWAMPTRMTGTTTEIRQ